MSEQKKDALICAIGIAVFAISMVTWFPYAIVALGRTMGRI